MRVLVLTTTLPHRSGDGTPSFVLDQLRALTPTVQFLVLAPRIKDSRPSESIDGVAVQRFRYAPTRWETLADDAILPQLRQRPWMSVQVVPLVLSMLIHAIVAGRRSRPDVIWAHWTLPAGAIGLVVSSLLRTPLLVTSHGSDAFALNAWPLSAIKRLVASRSDALVAVSSEVARRLGSDGRAIIQPAGVDTSLWQELVGNRTPHPRAALFVGRLAVNKGLHVAFDAMVQHPLATLRIVGDGPERETLKALACRLGIAERVTFLGRLTREELAAEYRRAEVLLVPSIVGPDGSQEGTPSVLGEAASVGLPVIASRLSGMAEFIEHGRTGLLFETGDASGLAGEIDRLATVAGLAGALSREARETLAPKLSLARSSAVYRRVLQGLSARPRRRRPDPGVEQAER